MSNTYVTVKLRCTVVPSEADPATGNVLADLDYMADPTCDVTEPLATAIPWMTDRILAHIKHRMNIGFVDTSRAQYFGTSILLPYSEMSKLFARELRTTVKLLIEDCTFADVYVDEIVYQSEAETNRVTTKHYMVAHVPDDSDYDPRHVDSRDPQRVLQSLPSDSFGFHFHDVVDTLTLVNGVPVSTSTGPTNYSVTYDRKLQPMPHLH